MKMIMMAHEAETLTTVNSLINSMLLHLQRKEPFKADEAAKSAPNVKF